LGSALAPFGRALAAGRGAGAGGRGA